MPETKWCPGEPTDSYTKFADSKDSCTVKVILAIVLAIAVCALMYSTANKRVQSNAPSFSSAKKAEIVTRGVTTLPEVIAESATDEEKTQLQKDIHKLTAKHDKVVFLFWAHWCGHCHKALPLFEKYAEQFPQVKFVAVHSVQAFPSILASSRKNFEAHELQYFPCVAMYSSKTDHLILYDKDVTNKDSFADFIKKDCMMMLF